MEKGRKEKKCGAKKRAESGRGGCTGENVREGRKRKGGVCKVAFWNIAGAENKDKDFWKCVEEWDVIVMCET